MPSPKCREICTKLYKPLPRKYGVKRYLSGQKRCSVCEAWIQWDGFHCPCCGANVRLRPEAKEFREKFYKDKENLKC